MNMSLPQQSPLEILIQEFNFWVLSSSYRSVDPQAAEGDKAEAMIVEYQKFFSLLSPVAAPNDNIVSYWTQQMTVISGSTDLTPVKEENTIDFASVFSQLEQKQQDFENQYETLLAEKQPQNLDRHQWMEALQWRFELSKNDAALITDWLNTPSVSLWIRKHFRKDTPEQKLLVRELLEHAQGDASLCKNLWSDLEETQQQLKRFDHQIDAHHQSFLGACWSYRRNRSKDHYIHQIKTQQNQQHKLVEAAQYIVEQVYEQSEKTTQLTAAIHGWMRLLLTEDSHQHATEWKMIAQQHKKQPFILPFNGQMIVDMICSDDTKHQIEHKMNAV